MRNTEIRDLIAAWIALSLAFANLLGGISNIESVVLAFFTAGLGFALHEIAHKIVAIRHGLNAEFQADYEMLGLAIAFSFLGFIFAAPGAVYTRGARNPKQQFQISFAGPVTNVVLALLFFLVPGQLGAYGFEINAWLALFNMIPFGGLDGESVLSYSKPIYAGFVVLAGALVFVL
jgi:Zn-dependent protease